MHNFVENVFFFLYQTTFMNFCVKLWNVPAVTEHFIRNLKCFKMSLLKVFAWTFWNNRFLHLYFLLIYNNLWTPGTSSAVILNALSYQMQYAPHSPLPRKVQLWTLTMHMYSRCRAGAFLGTAGNCYCAVQTIELNVFPSTALHVLLPAWKGLKSALKGKWLTLLKIS